MFLEQSLILIAIHPVDAMYFFFVKTFFKLFLLFTQTLSFRS